jgi:hypothetical protein
MSFNEPAPAPACSMLVVEDNLNSDARALEATVMYPLICDPYKYCTVRISTTGTSMNQTKIGVKNTGFHAKHVAVSL